MTDKAELEKWSVDDKYNLLFNGRNVGRVGLRNGKTVAQILEPVEMTVAESQALGSYVWFIDVARTKEGRS